MTHSRAPAWAQLRRGDAVPRIRLPSPDGVERSVRGRGSRILVVPHPDCPDCAAYVRSLASEAERLRKWDADVLVVAPGGGSAPDVEGAAVIRDASADPGAGLSVIVLDRWGEVYHAGHHGEGHGAESPGELVDWARFVAIQCPECEGPEGAWRQVGEAPKP